MNSVLVVAAHPDDEILGCGGTCSRLVAEGWAVHHLILAQGAASRSSNPSGDHALAGEIQALRQAAESAAEHVGATGVEFADFPDNRMDSVDLLDVVKRIEDSITRVRPLRVLTHHVSDVNIDHTLVHQAVAAATRPLPETSVRQVAFFEVPSSTEWRSSGSGQPFVPNLFVDITDHLEAKLAALKAYESEMRPFPHPRSATAVAHLAAWRGASAGVSAAEAFHIGRWIE